MFRLLCKSANTRELTPFNQFVVRSKIKFVGGHRFHHRSDLVIQDFKLAIQHLAHSLRIGSECSAIEESSKKQTNGDSTYSINSHYSPRILILSPALQACPPVVLAWIVADFQKLATD